MDTPPPSLYLTLDVDWAPDFVIDHVASILRAHRVHATWYVTHASPAIDRLRRHADLFELGIHPNFNADSSHGDTPETVLAHCMALVPEAVSMRSHGQLQSTCLLTKVLKTTPVDTDLSYLLPKMSHLAPACYQVAGRPFVRIPSYYEDDVAMEQPAPGWHADAFFDEQPGLKVLTFHPIHLYLNGTDMVPYEAAKRLHRSLHHVTNAQIAPFVQRGEGPGTLFTGLVERLAGTRTACIRDVREAVLRTHAVPASSVPYPA